MFNYRFSLHELVLPVCLCIVFFCIRLSQFKTYWSTFKRLTRIQKCLLPCAPIFQGPENNSTNINAIGIRGSYDILK